MTNSQANVSTKPAPAFLPFEWKVRVYYEDTDAGGIVFYANYLKFFERARTEWLRAAGVSQHLLEQAAQAIFVVSETSIQYHASARLDDELQVTVAVEKFGRASLEFSQQAWCGERMLASARIRVGCVNSISMRPCAIPANALQAIETQHRIPQAIT
jgi:acyl-CoA thioester hydrolase